MRMMEDDKKHSSVSTESMIPSPFLCATRLSLSDHTVKRQDAINRINRHTGFIPVAFIPYTSFIISQNSKSISNCKASDG